MAEIDLNSMSRAELTELRTQVDRAIASAGERDRKRALEAVENTLREHGLTMADLAPGTDKGRGAGKRGGRSAASSSAAPSGAKYRNPENPEQTWSGRGRRPQWVHEATANGRALAELEI
jgi:DNA-binding protein H-NS